MVLGAFLAQFVCVGGFYSFGVFLIQYQEAFGCSRGAAAGVGSVASVGFMGLAPVFGRTGDIYGARKTIFVGGLITMIAWMLCGLSTELWHVYMCQVMRRAFPASYAAIHRMVWI